MDKQRTWSGRRRKAEGKYRLKAQGSKLKGKVRTGRMKKEGRWTKKV